MPASSIESPSLAIARACAEESKNLHNDVLGRGRALQEIEQEYEAFANDLTFDHGRFAKVFTGIVALGKAVLCRLHDVDIAVSRDELQRRVGGIQAPSLDIQSDNGTIRVRPRGSAEFSFKSKYDYLDLSPGNVLLELPVSIALPFSNTRSIVILLALIPVLNTSAQLLGFRLSSHPLYAEDDGEQYNLDEEIPVNAQKDFFSEFSEKIGEHLSNTTHSINDFSISDAIPIRMVGCLQDRVFHLVSKTIRSDRSHKPLYDTRRLQSRLAVRASKEHIVPKLKETIQSFGASALSVDFRRGHVALSTHRHEHHEKTIIGPWDLDVYVDVRLNYKAYFTASSFRLSLVAYLDPSDPGWISVRVEDAPTKSIARKAAAKAMEVAKREVAKVSTVRRRVGSVPFGQRITRITVVPYGVLIFAQST